VLILPFCRSQVWQVRNPFALWRQKNYFFKKPSMRSSRQQAPPPPTKPLTYLGMTLGRHGPRKRAEKTKLELRNGVQGDRRKTFFENLVSRDPSQASWQRSILLRYGARPTGRPKTVIQVKKGGNSFLRTEVRHCNIHAYCAPIDVPIRRG
jgi:hypothetical protein